MTTIYGTFDAGQLDLTLVGATTVTSPNFANLFVVAAPDIMWLTFDPRGSAGAPEVVLVTAHTAGGNSITVVRGQQGTTARQHLAATPWCLGMTPVDNGVPVGVPLMWTGSKAGAVVPYGYLLCDGSAVSRTTYAALFAVMSTSYGVGDGSTTFNLPQSTTGQVPHGIALTATTRAATAALTAAGTIPAAAVSGTIAGQVVNGTIPAMAVNGSFTTSGQSTNHSHTEHGTGSAKATDGANVDHSHGVSSLSLSTPSTALVSGATVGGSLSFGTTVAGSLSGGTATLPTFDVCYIVRY